MDTMTDKHIAITLIICATAVICTWITRPVSRYRLYSESGIYLLDTASGRMWAQEYDKVDGEYFCEVEKRVREPKEPQQAEVSTPLRFNAFADDDATEETTRQQR